MTNHVLIAFGDCLIWFYPFEIELLNLCIQISDGSHSSTLNSLTIVQIRSPLSRRSTVLTQAKSHLPTSNTTHSTIANISSNDNHQPIAVEPNNNPWHNTPTNALKIPTEVNKTHHFYINIPHSTNNLKQFKTINSSTSSLSKSNKIKRVGKISRKPIERYHGCKQNSSCWKEI